MLEITRFWLNVRGEWLTLIFFEIQWRFTYFSLILWNETHLHSVRVLKIEEEKRSNTIVIIRIYVKFMQITFASHFKCFFLAIMYLVLLPLHKIWMQFFPQKFIFSLKIPYVALHNKWKSIRHVFKQLCRCLLPTFDLL